MRTRLLLMIAAMAGPALFAAPARAQETPELIVRRMKVVLRDAKKDGTPRDRLKITGVVPTEALPPGYDAEIDGLTVAVGGVTVLSFPPTDDRTRLVRTDGPRWRYREKRSKDRAGVRRLDLHVPSGHFTLRAKALDLGALRAAGPEAVPVVVTLGESAFATEIDFDANRRAWTFRSAPPAASPRVPPGGTTGVLAFRILDIGSYSTINQFETAVARDVAEYAVLWQRHRPPIPCVDPRMCPGVPVTPPPAVDFEKEIVVAVFLGPAPDGETADILSVARDGEGAIVNWAELRLGPMCPVPSWVTIPTPYVIAAMTRVSGEVGFVGNVQVKQCQ